MYGIPLWLFLGGVLFTAFMAAFYKSVLVGQAPGFNEFYNRSAIVHLKKAIKVSSMSKGLLRCFKTHNCVERTERS